MIKGGLTKQFQNSKTKVLLELVKRRNIFKQISAVPFCPHNFVNEK